jgi:prophage antirepressor-like protein
LNLDRKALGRLDDDEKGVSSIDTLGGAQQMTVFNEFGLYSLILGSRKPQAKAFKR